MPQAFWAFLYKMATRGHFVFLINDKNHRVLVIWDFNGYGEYEFDRCICDKVMACTSIGVRRWRRRRRRNQKHIITEIFKFRRYNYSEYQKQPLCEEYLALYMTHNSTRLFSRPQPQIYPPVDLNQYTGVKGTHNILYICFKAPQTF